MDLRDRLNRYYYDNTVYDLCQLNRSGGGNLSYNSMMYLDVISYQANQGHCTISSLAKTLHISNSAATIKVNELVKQGLVQKNRSQTDRRVVYLDVTQQVAEALNAYDRPFERSLQQIEKQFSAAEIETFCAILDVFNTEYRKEF